MIFKWLLGWSAERNGRRDGRNAIPLPDDTTPPPYLLVLRDAGQGRLRRLELSWKLKDKRLFTNWRRRKTLFEQAQATLAEARQAAGTAVQRHDASPKAKNATALARARRALAKAQSRLNRAQIELTHAAAKRQTRFDVYQARLNAICKETDVHMQRYIAANVGARDDGRTPVGLLDEHRPRLVVPATLQQLAWEEAGGAACADSPS
ncbi:MAG TPA: hypothetical protein VNT75_24945 [Symbiobacteriaceae bacterium]|nr:hypothetical protein [Symbiobacteriaceae bacterium]